MTGLRSRIITRTLQCCILSTLLFFTTTSPAEDVSPPAFLQWFDSSYDTIEERTADIYMGGYGAIWIPPPGRADLSDFSVGYDVYNRFDLGYAGRETLYGTETGIKTLARTLHRAGIDLHIDAVINHNGFSDAGTNGFLAAGGYPGFLLQNPDGGSDPFGIPGTDGDFNSSFDYGDLRGRLSGLIDIDHAENFRFIRTPVPGYGPVPGDHGGNLPAGVSPDGAGRLANIPLESNRRFYPDRNLNPISVFDPTTGQSDIKIYPFNTNNPMAGDPIGENATGLLMRYLQWMVQDVGVDGFRLDAAKHVEGFTFNFLDLAVYRSNPRLLLNGQTKNVFSYSEVFDGDRAFLQTFIRKDINPNDIGRVGGNRDVLDFAQYFAFKQNLSGNGHQNDFRELVSAGLDAYDDGKHNGSSGVMFVQSHDDFGPHLSNVAHAYMLMHPGNAIVYLNGREFGDNRDFPKVGRSDALGGVYGDTITTLTNIRNTHGRGDYRERWLEKELLAYERKGSALVLLSNRTDSGFDSRTLDVSFPYGTYLIELTGNAKNNSDIPELIQVFNDCFECQSKVNVRFLRNGSGDKGYLIYGLPTPQAPLGIQLTNVHSVILGGDPGANDYENGVTRLTDLHVIKTDSFHASLQTVEVNLLGVHRDPQADGDNALIKIDGGRDINNNGYIDFTTPGNVAYGFETFQTKHSDLWGGGDGEFIQEFDTTNLSEGVHYLEVIAFRHRDDGGPAVYSSFKKAVYIDRLPPNSTVDSFEPFGNDSEDRDLIIKSQDKTAESVHVFLNLPATVSDQDILNMAFNGDGKAAQYDRDLFKFGFFDIPSGNNVATVVSFERTGTSNVQRYAGLSLHTAIGLGIGDTNHDGIINEDDLANQPGAFEQILYSQNQQFNPAADTNGDGKVNTIDLLELQTVITQNASQNPALQQAYDALKRRRADFNDNGTTDAFDINTLFANRNAAAWLYDLNSDGTTNEADFDIAILALLNTQYGDANYDQIINIQDLSKLASNFNLSGSWTQGDFNGDGTVNIQDLALLASNYNFDANTAGGAASINIEQLLTPLAITAADQSDIPEPRTFLILFLLTIAILSPQRLRQIS